MKDQMWWDSESRKSPYSTVADPEDETCEVCGEEPTYSGADDKHGTCGCDAPVSYAPIPLKIAKVVCFTAHVAGCPDVAGHAGPLVGVKTTGDLAALNVVAGDCLHVVKTCTCVEDPCASESLDCPDHGKANYLSLVAEHEAEIAAENAWLHAAENAGYSDGADGIWT